MTINKTIYDLLTTSTGAALCDSGGAYGRHWERNQKRSIEDFENDPEAELSFEHGYANLTISVFHYLTKQLSENELCKEFNSLPVDDWDSEYYGTSIAGEEWLKDNGFEPEGNGFNTYNGDSVLSQVLQGQLFKHDFDLYVLLQIHNGCDVRGGYTDAKLFKLNDYYLVENCGGFEVGSNLIDYYSGEFVNEEGQYLDYSDFEEIAKKYEGKSFEGFIF